MTNSLDLRKLQKEFKQELNRILEYWFQHTIDEQNGGFIGQIKHNGEANPHATKGAVLNARLLWTFAAANRMLADPKCREMANRAYAYLKEYFWDHEKGGIFWELNYLGNPLNTRKQAYGQGFGIYAFSEYYRASGNKESLDFAIQLFELLESHFADDKFGGYIEAHDRNWEPLKDMRLSERDANYPKSMNTHLHILESYTNLYRVWPNAKLRQRIQHLLQVFAGKIVDRQTGHFNLFFEMDWTCKSDIVSFGHDIEGAWLLREAAIEIRQDNLKIEGVALRLVGATLREGTDSDGSIFSEKVGDKLDTNKHWWMQAEAMVGLMDAYQITDEKPYLESMGKVWDFIKKHVIDFEKGEWFGHVDQYGNPLDSEDKAGFWKCPYHNSRAMMELIERIDRMDRKD